MFIKSFVNSLVDISLTFSDWSFSFFRPLNLSFYLKQPFLLRFFSLSSKSVFFKKSTISAIVASFACANLAANLSAVNLLNSRVVI